MNMTVNIGTIPHVKADNLCQLLTLLPRQPEINAILDARSTELFPTPEAASLPPVLVEVMEKLTVLTSCFNPIELCTIDNYQQHRHDFLTQARCGVPKNPRFTYHQSTAALLEALEAKGTTLNTIEARLRQLDQTLSDCLIPPEHHLGHLARSALLTRIADDRATITLVHGLQRGDDRQVKTALIAKYGQRLDDTLHDAARLVYGYLHTRAHNPTSTPLPTLTEGLASNFSSWLTHEPMTAQTFGEAVIWMCARYYSARSNQVVPNALRFKVVISNKFTAIDVRDKSSEGSIIGIPNRTRTCKAYLKLMRHEIEAHVRQSLNGSLLLGFGGGPLKTDDETWYEGLAKDLDIRWSRTMFGETTALPPLPYYTFAIRMAEQGSSFVEVFKTIRQLRLAIATSPDDAASSAWSTTYRIFRGHSDTHNREAFAMSKDQAYLRGWILMSQLREHGLSHLNEAAISPIGGLRRLARFDIRPEHLPLPDLGLTQRYLHDVLQPRFHASR